MMIREGRTDRRGQDMQEIENDFRGKESMMLLNLKPFISINVNINQYQ